ncbi:ABC transporter permease [Blautia sp. HCP3S3_G3]|uniref:ABC transporter permease n=1 Tax=Blautia sp. HCP3S3_G3 TaxID=3438913 RepID=UPI003F8AE504
MNLIISILSGAIVYAVSVMYAGIGETFSERAGIMNLGVEGIMLMGAVAGYITAVNTQNLALSFLVVLLTGAAFGLVFAFLTVTLQADQTVCGMAMLTFGTGLSGFLGKDVTGVAANLKFQTMPIPLLKEIPVIGPIFFQQNLLVYAMYVIVPLSLFYIYRTKYGLYLRALGENPAALDSAGMNIFAMRYAYVILGCAMIAVSGACVTLANTNFWSPGMTAGKGWIAFALVAFSSWNPLKLTLGALLFGFISCLGSNLQIYFPGVPTEIFSAMPYIATIIAFILATGNFRKVHTAQPAALCKPYDRENR